MKFDWKWVVPVSWLAMLICVGCLSYLFEVKIQSDQMLLTPGTSGYILGSDNMGRPLAPLVFQSLPLSIGIAFLSMLISLLIATLVGGWAAYLGNQKLKIKRSRLVASIALLVYLLIFIPFFTSISAIGVVLLAISGISIWFFLAFILGKLSVFRSYTHFPIDFLGLKMTEIMAAIPLLIIVLAVAAVAKNTAWVLIIILGATGWTRMARLFRGEILVKKSMPYVLSAEQQGYPYISIFFRHVLPNSLSPLVPAFTFGLASMIIIESSLSFIGIGLPPETITLGKLIRQFYKDTHAWWIGLFPGLLLISIVLSFHAIGDYLASKLKS